MELRTKEVRNSPQRQYTCMYCVDEFDKACVCLQTANEPAPQIASIETMRQKRLEERYACVLL